MLGEFGGSCGPITRKTLPIAGKSTYGRYNLTPEQRQEMVASMMQIVRREIPGTSNRDVVMANKALIAADSVDLKEEQGGSQSGGNRFLIVAQQLGISTDSGHIAEGPAALVLEQLSSRESSVQSFVSVNANVLPSDLEMLELVWPRSMI